MYTYKIYEKSEAKYNKEVAILDGNGKIVAICPLEEAEYIVALKNQWEGFMQFKKLKKPRLFYYEDTELALMPAPDKIVEIIDCENFLADGDEITITFKRIDMADEEFENLPED